jgi:hypothetical protein
MPWRCMSKAWEIASSSLNPSWQLWVGEQEYLHVWFMLMFGLCVALVAHGYFKEVQLSFLIVGHTHEDINQWFSIISNTLKRQDVDSLLQLLRLINEGTSFTESIVSASLLENVWDWKSFINLYLMTRGDSFVGIFLPHYMRFSMTNSVARV